jgi:hypothetical protein
MFNTFPPPPENRVGCDILSKNMMEPDVPKITSQSGTYASHDG